LVIDDDRDIGQTLAFWLRGAGFRVLIEESGSLGVRRAREERPALIVCALRLSSAPGELVVVGLRRDPATAPIPIVATTADPGSVGPEHPVDAVIAKPIDGRTLVGVVRRLMTSPALRGMRDEG